MTEQEAIRLMRILPTMCVFTDAYGEPIDSDAYYEAVEMAISALQAQDVPDTNDGDMVSRQRVIDELKRYFHDEYYQRTSIQDCIDCFIEDILIKLPSAQPESTRTFVELVVRYPDPELCAYKEYKGKPYYSIKYIENGETYVGYGTYNPEVLSQYLKEYFISSVQPEIKPIDYQDCANAMLRMWMDEVVTDGEYNRIMDKLNAFWRTRNERSD